MDSPSGLVDWRITVHQGRNPRCPGTTSTRFDSISCARLGSEEKSAFFLLRGVQKGEAITCLSAEVALSRDPDWTRSKQAAWCKYTHKSWTSSNFMIDGNAYAQNAKGRPMLTFEFKRPVIYCKFRRMIHAWVRNLIYGIHLCSYTVYSPREVHQGC